MDENDPCTDDECYAQHCTCCNAHVNKRDLCDECAAERADMIRDQRKDDYLADNLDQLNEFNRNQHPTFWK